MIDQPRQRHLMTFAYTASVILVAGYTFWLYGMGKYHDLLVPMFVTLLLLTALLMHHSQALNPVLPRAILLGSSYIITLAAFYSHPSISTIWIGLPTAAAFFLLPLSNAFLLTVFSSPLWWLLTRHSDASSEIIIAYTALILLMALPPWEHARQRALLRATDPNDNDCNAYHIDTLKERLHNEFLRAAMLNKRLAVLVMHLPQLDMAEEQFGSRAQTALLGALCNEVNSRCRDHDLLGRADNATFWLVLPDTSESGAMLVRERLQRALSQRVLVETGQLETRIAVCLPCRNESFERYINRLEARAKALSIA
ncbi:diguanylate cyclase [Halomonas campaniensis]|uniref:Diguanylate cyclase n=1 Tax=Vreelandella alkaliphila TaxID=272774 RepID=A0AAJ2S4X4_9GAMM|nr:MULTISPECIES: diguanylate cyclase [Halomonas]AIA75841.1 diguanylate cyclase [Halomonas campaniensis]AYF35353.1 diguanylate cyclase [Halomonas alkaliphila]MCD6006316.1 diguanylate cyclase [Halomonas sp. IOP_6]MDX5979415.1 diguanylate cyclase [Halomonas alkaliphila]